MATQKSALPKWRLIGVVALLTALFVPAQGAAAQYGPPDEPTLVVDVLQPVCDGGVPYLNYTVQPVHGVDDTVTITWLHPSNPGMNVVRSGLPLSGSVLWPGAEVDAAGNPLDWPGWRLEGGDWVEGDEWDWVRPSTQVSVAVNPEATFTVAYPPSSPNCSTNPPGRSDPPAQAAPPGDSTSNRLAVTGAGVAGLLGVVLALVLLGTAALVTARRRGVHS